MFSVEEFTTAVLRDVDDLLSEMSHSLPIRTRGFAPALSDSGMLSTEIVTECLGMDADSKHLALLSPPLVQPVSCSY